DHVAVRATHVCLSADSGRTEVPVHPQSGNGAGRQTRYRNQAGLGRSRQTNSGYLRLQHPRRYSKVGAPRCVVPDPKRWEAPTRSFFFFCCSRLNIVPGPFALVFGAVRESAKNREATRHVPARETPVFFAISRARLRHNSSRKHAPSYNTPRTTRVDLILHTR